MEADVKPSLLIFSVLVVRNNQLALVSLISLMLILQHKFHQLISHLWFFTCEQIVIVSQRLIVITTSLAERRKAEFKSEDVSVVEI